MTDNFPGFKSTIAVTQGQELYKTRLLITEKKLVYMNTRFKTNYEYEQEIPENTWGRHPAALITRHPKDGVKKEGSE